MKYMGSKRAMLGNGLGKLLLSEAAGREVVVDLFSGSGVVSWWIAEQVDAPVHSFDLQRFAASLAGAVVCRTSIIPAADFWQGWYERALNWLKERDCDHRVVAFTGFPARFTKSVVLAARKQSAELAAGRINLAYGGYYLSPQQAAWVDALRSTVPVEPGVKDVGIAAVVRAVSSCCASPGHTAQPLRPTTRGLPAIREAWERNLVRLVREEFFNLCSRRAMKRGQAGVADANNAAKSVDEGALVFVDPPYSAVHYSRFYHVLESVVRPRLQGIEGAGRYPSAAARPRSYYSIASTAKERLVELLTTLAQRRATVILTYPYKKCSNGLSGQFIESRAKQLFARVERKLVHGRFSTMGGDGSHREARQPSAELILVMRPKGS